LDVAEPALAAAKNAQLVVDVSTWISFQSIRKTAAVYLTLLKLPFRPAS